MKMKKVYSGVNEEAVVQMKIESDVSLLIKVKFIINFT